MFLCDPNNRHVGTELDTKWKYLELQEREAEGRTVTSFKKPEGNGWPYEFRQSHTSSAGSDCVYTGAFPQGQAG